MDNSEIYSIAENLSSKAKSFDVCYTIDSKEKYLSASEDLKNIKRLQKEIEDQRTKLTAPLNKTIKYINNIFKQPKDFLSEAEKTLKAAILDFNKSQEDIFSISSKKAQEKSIQEIESLEEQRIASLKNAEDARKQSLISHEAGDLLSAKKFAAEEMEHLLLAKTFDEAKDILSCAPMEKPDYKIEGIAKRKTFKALTNDLMALVKAIAEGKAPIDCVVPNEKFLCEQARAMKKENNEEIFPGVISECNVIISSKAS